MRRITITLASLLVAASILGCPLKKKKLDAVDDDEPIADAATVTVSGTGAKNEKDVTRYQREEKLADEPAVIVKDSVKVKSFPGGGHDIATLGKGAAVTKVAKYFSTAVLVSFDDPAGDGKLLGWVLPDQISAPSAPASSASATVAPAVKPVIKPPSDAGAPASKDAGGGAAAADAGGQVPAVDAGVRADAGTAPAPVSTTALFVPLGSDGKCPPGFASSGGGCRRPCNADGDCPRKAFCVASSGKKFCQSSK